MEPALCAQPSRISLLVSAADVLCVLVLGTHVCDCYLYAISAVSGLCPGSRASRQCWTERFARPLAGYCDALPGREDPRPAWALSLDVGARITGHWPTDRNYHHWRKAATWLSAIWEDNNADESELRYTQHAQSDLATDRT